MELMLYLFGAFLIWIAGILVYQFARVFVARFFGVKVIAVGIGAGPIIYQKVGPRLTFEIGLIPIGGSTTFGSSENAEREQFAPDSEDLPPPTSQFADAPSVAKILILLSGPLASGFLGAICLFIPTQIGANQWQICPANESLVQPCVVGGLKPTDQPSNWRSQWQLFCDTAGEWTIRLLTFKSFENWGGLVAFFATCGEVGKQSVAGWLSCLGVLLLWQCAFNFLPIPVLSGYDLLRVVSRGLTGWKLPQRIQHAFFWAGFLYLMVIYARALCIDLRWMWNAWF